MEEWRWHFGLCDKRILHFAQRLLFVDERVGIHFENSLGHESLLFVVGVNFHLLYAALEIFLEVSYIGIVVMVGISVCAVELIVGDVVARI